MVSNLLLAAASGCGRAPRRSRGASSACLLNAAPPPRLRRPWRLDDDFAYHLWVQRAEIVVLPRCREGLRKSVVGIERRGFKFPVLLDHRVHVVIIIGP